MTQDVARDNLWNLFVTNYREYEYHDLTTEALNDVLQEEWMHDFNGLTIGRTTNCIGQLIVFYQDDNAYVAYESFENQEWRCSYDLKAGEQSDRNELIRLTPANTQEYSFRKCCIIRKSSALRIVERYIASGEVTELHLLDAEGKPLLGDQSSS